MLLLFQLVNLFVFVQGKLSSLEDLRDIPFPVKYYTLSEKDLEDNGYSFSLPGIFLSFALPSIFMLGC